MPDGMFCVKDTPVAVMVGTALLHWMPGNCDERAAVRAAPLVVERKPATASAWVFTSMATGLYVGLAVGASTPV